MEVKKHQMKVKEISYTKLEYDELRRKCQNQYNLKLHM